MAMQQARDGIDIGILVADIGRSLDFYVGLLGLEKIEEVDLWFGKMHRLKFGSSFVKLIEPDNPPPAGPSNIEDQGGVRYLTFPVSNIDAVCSACAQAGVIFAREKQEIRPGTLIAMLRDPDGAIVELVERR